MEERSKNEDEKRLVQFMETPVGRLRIVQKGNCIAEILRKNAPEEGMVEQETKLLQETIFQLKEYFEGKRKEFTVPLDPEGTMFQKRAWEILCTIPYGKTISYGEEAKRMKCGCARAVGGANGKNPICILIPCHRVIRGDGAIGGYTGGLDMKEYLLALEKKFSGNYPAGLRSRFGMDFCP